MITVNNVFCKSVKIINNKSVYQKGIGTNGSKPEC